MSLLAQHDIDAAIAVLEVAHELKQQIAKCVRCNLDMGMQQQANDIHIEMAKNILREFGGKQGMDVLRKYGYA